MVTFLNKRISTKDSLLIRYGQKDQYWKNIDDVNKGKIGNLNLIIDNDKKIIIAQDETIKKQKKLGLVKIGLGIVLGLFIAK